MKQTLTLTLMLLIFLFSCSKGDKSGGNNGDDFSPIIELSSLGILTELIGGVNTIPSASLDFGSLEYGQVVQQDLIITNKQLSPLVITSEDLNASLISPFEIASNTCIGSIARNRACKISLKLANTVAVLENTSLAKTLFLKDAVISLTGEKKVQVISTQPVVGMIVSPLSLDFGDLKTGESKELTVLVTNKTLEIQTVLAPANLNPKITMSNLCTASLARNRSCSIKFKYTASSDEVVTNDALSSLFNNPIQYSVAVSSTPTEINVTPSSTLTSVQVLEPAIKTGTINFINNGTIAFPAPISAVASSPGITISSVSCSATGLLRNRSCSVVYSLNSALLPVGLSSQTIKLQSGMLISSVHSLAITVTSTAPVLTYVPTYSSFANCSAALACSGVGIESRTVSSCQKLSNGEAVSGGIISDCSAFAIPANLEQSCSSPAGTIADIITGGTKNSSCLEGSTIKMFTSLDCSEGFNQNITSQICEPKVVTYLAVDTTASCSSLEIPVCQGTYPISKSYICEQYIDGVKNNNYVSNSSDCTLPNMDNITCSSPAGEYTVQLTSNEENVGSVTYSCPEGSMVETVVSSTCNPDRDFRPQSQDCRLATYQVMMYDNDCSTDPIASLRCSGTVEIERNITACRRIGASGTAGGITLVENSECVTRANNYDPQLYCSSPAASFTETRSSGEFTMACHEGSATINVASVSCSQGFVANEAGNDCVTNGPTQFASIKGIADGSVLTIKKLADGSVIYGGSFTKFINPDGQEFTVGRIIKINVDGTLNQQFQQNIGTGFNLNVAAIVIDASSNIYAGGGFTSFNGMVNINRIAKLSSTGIFDTTFSNNLDFDYGVHATFSGFDGSVTALALDTSGNIYVGGSFQGIKGVSYNANRIAKLSSTGIFDTTFSNNLDVVSGTKTFTSGFNSTVNAIAVDTSGNVYVGGGFTSFKNIANNANRIAKLSSTGVFDTIFSNNLDVVSGTKAATSGFLGTTNSIAVDTSGNIYVGGFFVMFKYVSNSSKYIAKLSSTGVFDQAFSNKMDVISGTKELTSGFDSIVNSVFVNGTTELYVGGAFISFKNSSANKTVKLDLSGNKINFIENLGGFDGGSINKIIVDGSGNIYVAGFFSYYNGIKNSYLVKFKPNYELDMEFLNNIGTGFNSGISTMVLDTNDNLYLGGSFTSFNGIANNANSIAKLSSTGIFDTTFSNNLDVVSGTKAFTSGFNSMVNAIAVDTSGNVYVGGSFTSFKNIANNANSIAKLSSTGIFDTTFSNNLDAISGNKAPPSGFNSMVNAIAVDTSGNVYVGGGFTSFKNIANNARYIAKLSSNGVFNQAFSDNLDVIPGTKATSSSVGTNVNTIVLDSSDNLYLGGSFTSFKGLTNNARYIAKLSSNGVFNQAFSDNLDVIPGTKDSSSGFSGIVRIVVVDSSGNLFVGGSSTSFKGISNNANGIAKLSSTGIFNQEFSDNLDVISGTKAITSGFSGSIKSITLDLNDNLFLGKDNSQMFYKGSTKAGIFMLNNDGTNE